jgi:hypothetical protein
MSYDIELKDPKTGEVITFEEPHDIRGGTYAIGGSPKAWVNITYNYSPFFYKHICPEKGIRALYGKTGAEAVNILLPVIRKLGNLRSENYWDATPGNAGAALTDLLVLCLSAPHAIIRGD